jgi:DeoR/GlpR family transcriptional regulator of sugar metabolism
MSQKIFREERLKLMTKHILADDKVYVNELAEEFGVSLSSIRTDLSELEAWASSGAPTAARSSPRR